MTYGNYLIPNRHHNRWYSRVVIPKALRYLYDGKREIRKPTGTAGKRDT